MNRLPMQVDIRDVGSIPGSGRSSRGGNGNPFQYSCLENPKDIEAWRAIVHRVTQSQTQLSDFTFAFHYHVLEKDMATHSSILAWRIPRTEEPSGLQSQSLESQRHKESDLTEVS